MRSVHSATGLIFALVLTCAGLASAQTNPASQPRLEILGRQGDYYWVVETAPDGSRKGGWVNAQVIDSINRSALRAIPAQPAPYVTIPAVDVPNNYDGLVLSLQQMRSKVANAVSALEGPPDATLNERLAKIDEAAAVLQSLATDQSAEAAAFSPQPATSVRAAPLRQIAQPNGPRPQTREGFWFSGGLGYGALGCDNCNGRASGLSGGLSLGRTISEKLLLGVGTTGWYRSEDGLWLNVGTVDARLRFYPSVTSGFFLTGGLGIGTISLGVADFGSVSETGLGLMLGLGWDIRVRPNLSLTPFWNGSAVRTSGADANFGQFGLGITVH